MIKMFCAAVLTVFALAAVAPEPADAAPRKRIAKVKTTKGVATYQGLRRPASVGPNGLCQRDTGTPESQLNFRNVCDVEEYWQRIMDRGSQADR